MLARGLVRCARAWKPHAGACRAAAAGKLARSSSGSNSEASQGHLASAAAACALLLAGGASLCDTEPQLAQFDSAKFTIPSYAGEVCIVTGGSTGIGAATCRALSDAGAKVYSIDVSPPPGGPAKGVHHITADVSNVRQLQLAVGRILTESGDRVDLLVSNAGVWCGGPLEDVTECEFDRIVGINVKGAFFAVQAVLPSMRKRKNGAIIIVGSDQTLVGKPGQNLYGLTKGALGQFAKSTGAQYAPEGIRVNCVCPGTIDTPLMHKAVDTFSGLNAQPKEDLYNWLETAQPLPRLGSPEEVAALIATVAKIPFVCGALISIDGGYTCQ